MTAVALRGLMNRKLRASLTAFAIVLGVAMISGSFVLTDTISKAFDSISGQSYKNADVVVTGKAAFENFTTDLPEITAAVFSYEPLKIWSNALRIVSVRT